MSLLRRANNSDLTVISQCDFSELDLLFWANTRNKGTDLHTAMKVWQTDLDSSAFTFEVDSEIVGYGEVWKVGDEVEIARIIVLPTFRRQGHARTLVRKLLEEAKQHSSNIWLRVHPENLIAIRLYVACGFTVAEQEDQQKFNQDQPIQFVWMKAI